MASPYMTPRLRQFLSTSWLTLGGSTMTSPRVATATQHLSNNHNVTPAALGGSAISSSTIWRHLLSLFGGFYFGSTSSMQSKISSRVDSIVPNKAKCSFILHKVDYHLLSPHPTLGGCTAYIHFTYHQIRASNTACEKESQGKDRKSLFICAGDSKFQSI
jgi:hypothetical protein